MFALVEARTPVARRTGMPSWMLARLKRETPTQHATAYADRLQPLGSAITVDSYKSFLRRIWGFEAPLEAAFAKTPELGEVIDLRGRAHIKLLRTDLTALGITSPSEIPCCRMIPTFHSIADALGWMYVVENNALVNGEVRRHLEKRIPAGLASAGAYLCGGERSVGIRLNELGRTLDSFASEPELPGQIIDAAKIAFQRQSLWLARPPASAEFASNSIFAARRPGSPRR